MAKKLSEIDRFIAFDDAIREHVPSLHRFLADEGDYRGLSIRPRDDGSFLAVAMGVSSDGVPVVCFGQGYGAIGALFGLERTIGAGKWKKDKFAKK